MTKEYSWKSKKSKPASQIDLLIHRKDMVINVCEMKYSIDKFSISKEYEENLKNKLQTFTNEVKPKEQLVLTFITFNGLQKNEHSELVLSQIDGEQLFGQKLKCYLTF